MKKGLILTVLYILLLLGIFIVPPLCERIRFEESNNAFVPAVNLCQVRKEVGEAELPGVLKSYKESGVTTAVIDDGKHECSAEELVGVSEGAGFDICLAVYPDSRVGEDETAALLKSGRIKYALLKESKNPQRSDALLEAFKESKAILVLSENISQLSNQKPSSYDEFIEAANGRVMRTYRTYEHLNSDDLDYNAPAFQMINSVIDRNTDFVTITQIKDGEGTEKDKERTKSNIRHFVNRMKNLGFAEGKEPRFEGYRIYNTAANAAGAALGVLLFAAMIMLIMRKYSGKLALLSAAVSAAAFAAYFALPVTLKLLTPTAFALVSSLFSLTLVFYLADKKRNLSLIKYISLLFAVSLFCLLICGAVLCAMLGGLSYHLNTNVFRGVKLCLALPILYGAVLSFVNLYGTEPLKKPLHFIKENTANIKPYHFVVFVMIIAAMVMFLLRSGNDYDISRFELRMRNFASDTLRQRPRTKEFLVGWPALAALAYFKNKRFPRSLTWLVSVPACILFSSVTNSFCHVFTNALTIYGRTVDGFLVGAVFAAVLLALVFAAQKVAGKRRKA
ncbi:MAG: hypothetical protein J5590_03875 [Clostridia bacterium]|nr:hypothetical protein [Clostridia bacterium]